MNAKALAGAFAVVAAGCAPDLLSKLPDAGVPASSCRHTLFLNGGPASITPGAADSVEDTSPLVADAHETGGATMEPEAWEAYVECVAGHLPYDIAVVSQSPSPLEHFEIVIADRPSELGFDDVTVGASDGDCAWNPRRNGFVFLEKLYNPESGDIEVLCQFTAFTFGYMATLDIVEACDDLMSVTADSSCDPAFRDREIPCAQGACRCGGTTQNSHLTLLGAFGPRECEAR